MKYLVLLLLTGCATQSLDDLYLERASCVSQGSECGDLDDRITAKEDIRQWRLNAKPPKCPSGYFAYCDRFVRGCGRDISKFPVEYMCVSSDQLGRIFW